MKPFLSRLHIARAIRVLLLLAASCALPAHAMQFSTNTQLTVSGSVAQDGVGSSVAVSADNHTLIFGAPAATVNGVANAGKVYVFTRGDNGTWTQQAALTEAGIPGSDAFGSSVALSADGNTAIIGAPIATVSGQSNSGKVYIFTRSGNSWSGQTSFSEPTPASGDQFGLHVAVSADAQTLLIGAPDVTVNTQSQAGATFAYTLSNGIWSGPTELTASDATAKSHFGTVALSADGNTALIGAGSTPINSTPSAGKVYFFTRSNGNWSQSQEFSDPGTGSDEFGTAVALSGDGKTAAVGAFYTTLAGPPQPFGTGAGEAYIYTLVGGSWSLQQVIPNPLSETGNLEGGFEGNFGVALSLSADGNTALITADQITAPSSMGQAFAFARSDDTWKELKEIDDPRQTSRDDFGVSAALNSAGDTAFVGSDGGSGAHYVFVIDSPADLALALTADHSVVSPGQSLTYMLTATNNDSEVTATNVTVADTLPSGVAATNVTSGCTGTTGTITCVDAALAPGATYQPSITVAAPANATGQPFNITDNATVNADQVDPDTNNNSASLPVIVLASSGGTSSGGGKSGSGALDLATLLLLGALLTIINQGRR